MPTETSRPASDPRALTLGTYVGYGVGSLGTSIFSTVPGLLLLFFMTDTLGISPGFAGLTASLPKLWDLVADPLTGGLSDRTRSAWGRRRPYLLAGAFLLPVFFTLTFSVPAFESPTTSGLWVMAAFVLAATSFTVFQVPYVAMPAEMTPYSHESTVVISWRMAFLTVGTLVAGGLSPMLVEWGGGGRQGYSVMALVLSALCFGSFLAAFFGTANAPRAVPTDNPPPIRAQLAAALQNRRFRVLVLSLVVQVTGVGVLLACVPYLSRYLLGGTSSTVTALFLALMIPALAGMPAWTWVSGRLGKVRSYRLSIALFGVASVGLFFTAPGREALVFPVIAVMGLAFAGTQVFPFALLPDTLREDASQAGVRREGFFTGLFTASEKAGNALGALAAGVVLSASGFVESVAGIQSAQPESALLGIRIAVSLAPLAFMLLCLVVLHGYEESPAADAPPSPALESQ